MINKELEARVNKIMRLANTTSPQTSADLQIMCDTQNTVEYPPNGYDCDKCKNRGHSLIVKDDAVKMVLCDCAEIRKNMRMIEKSGLSEAIKRLTFDSYQTPDKWQKTIKG